MDITRRFLGGTAMLDLEGRLRDGPAEVEQWGERAEAGHGAGVFIGLARASD